MRYVDSSVPTSPQASACSDGSREAFKFSVPFSRQNHRARSVFATSFEGSGKFSQLLKAPARLAARGWTLVLSYQSPLDVKHVIASRRRRDLFAAVLRGLGRVLR